MQGHEPTNKKITLLFILFLLGFLLVLGRYTYIQLIGRESYVERVVEKFPKATVVKLSAPRGAIKDRNGKDLAMSIPTLSVYAFPHLVKNREELARRISAVAGVGESHILSLLEDNRKFVWLVRHVNKDYAPYIRAVINETDNSKAVGLHEDFKRIYPHGMLASNLLGFVGSDGKGLEGLEHLFNPILQPKEVKAIFYSTQYMGRLAKNPISEDVKQNDLHTTIDLGVQIILEDIRDKIVKQWRPDRVGILVIDAKTGDILGLTTYPNFDPNNYWKYPQNYRRNYVVSDLFEPGSVMKPFFIGEALARGYIKPGMIIDTEGGLTEVFGKTVKDVHPYKSLSIEQVLIKSSNVGTIKVARFLSRKDVEEMMQKLYLKDEFHLLPGEIKPKLPNFSYPANILYASIGQGLGVNLLNLCTSFNALATNRIVKPRILLEEEVKVLREKVFPPKVYGWLHENLVKVVEEGTARQARSDYFTIAGKTGTSQKFDFRAGRYSREELVTYFVGYFPATDPRFIAGIMVDRPRGPNPYGGTVAAPHFRELVERIAFYYRLEQDKLSK
ncbi:MAG: penicillin-binding protein 2 [Acidobacteria bacterium]|nr:MAG: penicillin-binding protein 2 [Acidobacteriota bacterium]